MSPLLQDGGLLSLLGDSDTELVIGHATFTDDVRSHSRTGAGDSAGSLGAGRGRGGALPPGFRAYDEFIGDAAEANPPDAGVTDHDVFNIMYSSGTTGTAEGHRPHALRPGDVLHAVRLGLPDHAGERRAARRLDRLQRRAWSI